MRNNQLNALTWQPPLIAPWQGPYKLKIEKKQHYNAINHKNGIRRPNQGYSQNSVAKEFLFGTK